MKKKQPHENITIDVQCMHFPNLYVKKMLIGWQAVKFNQSIYHILSKKVKHLILSCRNMGSQAVIVVGNELSEQNSIPGQNCLGLTVH